VEYRRFLFFAVKRYTLRLSVFLLFINFLPVHAQEPLLSRKQMDLENTAYWQEISTAGRLDDDYSFLAGLDFQEIVYLSDGLKINGYVIAPAGSEKLPVVIFNRGGNRDFGMLTTETLVEWLAPIASAGYMIVAGQYRGGGGSEGKDEFGGKDIDDVLNLLPVVDLLPGADTSRIGMYGWSRGGMMTYLALAKSNCIKTAVIGGAPTDLLSELDFRPRLEKLYRELIPGYDNDKTAALKSRSAIYWPEKLCPATSLLILHGTNDERVPYQQAEAMAQKLDELQRDCQLVLFQNDDHIVSANRRDRDEKVISWLDEHLK